MKKPRFRLAGAALAAACIALLPHAAGAHGVQFGAIAIGHPYARPTVAGQPVAAGYLSLDNHGAGDRLLAAGTAIAERVELHAMWLDGDVMRMRMRDAIDLPAGAKVEFKPGGMHLMFIGLKAPLKAGDKFALTLRFEKAGTVEVVVNVQATASAAGAASAHQGMHH